MATTNASDIRGLLVAACQSDPSVRRAAESAITTLRDQHPTDFVRLLLEVASTDNSDNTSRTTAILVLKNTLTHDASYIGKISTTAMDEFQRVALKNLSIAATGMKHERRAWASVLAFFIRRSRLCTKLTQPEFMNLPLESQLDLFDCVVDSSAEVGTCLSVTEKEIVEERLRDLLGNRLSERSSSSSSVADQVVSLIPDVADLLSASMHDSAARSNILRQIEEAAEMQFEAAAVALSALVKKYFSVMSDSFDTIGRVSTLGLNQSGSDLDALFSLWNDIIEAESEHSVSHDRAVSIAGPLTEIAVTHCADSDPADGNDECLRDYPEPAFELLCSFASFIPDYAQTVMPVVWKCLSGGSAQMRRAGYVVLRSVLEHVPTHLMQQISPQILQVALQDIVVPSPQPSVALAATLAVVEWLRYGAEGLMPHALNIAQALQAIIQSGNATKLYCAGHLTAAVFEHCAEAFPPEITKHLFSYLGQVILMAGSSGDTDMIKYVLPVLLNAITHVFESAAAEGLAAEAREWILAALQMVHHFSNDSESSHHDDEDNDGDDSGADNAQIVSLLYGTIPAALDAFAGVDPSSSAPLLSLIDPLLHATGTTLRKEPAPGHNAPRCVDDVTLCLGNFVSRCPQMRDRPDFVTQLKTIISFPSDETVVWEAALSLLQDVVSSPLEGELLEIVRTTVTRVCAEMRETEDMEPQITEAALGLIANSVLHNCLPLESITQCVDAVAAVQMKLLEVLKTTQTEASWSLQKEILVSFSSVLTSSYLTKLTDEDPTTVKAMAVIIVNSIQAALRVSKDVGDGLKSQSYLEGVVGVLFDVSELSARPFWRELLTPFLESAEVHRELQCVQRRFKGLSDCEDILAMANQLARKHNAKAAN